MRGLEAIVEVVVGWFVGGWMVVAENPNPGT